MECRLGPDLDAGAQPGERGLAAQSLILQLLRVVGGIACMPRPGSIEELLGAAAEGVPEIPDTTLPPQRCLVRSRQPTYVEVHHPGAVAGVRYLVCGDDSGEGLADKLAAVPF